MRATTLAAATLILEAALVAGAAAQTRTIEASRPLPRKSLTLTYTQVDFSLADAGTPLADLEYANPLFGLKFAHPLWRGMAQLRFGYGAQAASAGEPELDVIDVELLVWQKLRVAGERGTEVSLTLPILFEYRRFGLDDPDTEEGSVGTFQLGIGGGLAVDSRLGSRLTLEARAAPMLTLPADFDQQDRFFPAVGAAADFDVAVHWERAFGSHHGLTVGASLRAQRWELGVDELFPDSDEDFFTYESLEPEARIGFHW